MFSFLRNGDIHNTIKTITNLPGLFTADGDKIKYALLNHSTAMRKNLGDGVPIFTNIRDREAEIEKRDIDSIASRNLRSMVANAGGVAVSKRTSPITDNDLRIDNAALTLIMAKELAFLNRTIQMISLIATRYQEEQEDLMWGRNDATPRVHHHHDLEINDDTPGSCDGGYYENDCVLSRSQSYDHDHDHDHDSHSQVNQLAATFIISSSRLRQRFNALCVLVGTTTILVNGMTTMDRPHTAGNRENQLLAEKYVISDIFLHFGKFDTEHRDPVVAAFLELRDISVSAWMVMSMYAFSNLFRLTEGSEFAMYQPNDAVFTQGRDYRLHSEPFYQEAAVLRFPTDTTMKVVVDEEEWAIEAQMATEEARKYD